MVNEPKESSLQQVVQPIWKRKLRVKHDESRYVAWGISFLDPQILQLVHLRTEKTSGRTNWV